MRLQERFLAVVVVVVVVGCDGGGGGAGSTLPVDCTSADNGAKPQCATAEPNGGVLGTGPSIGLDTTGFVGGYIDGDALVVGGAGDGNGAEAFVMSIDLKTGNRTLLTGTLGDALLGNLSQGTGEQFNPPTTVVKGANGPVVGSGSLYEVAANGDRTLTADFSTLVCETAPGGAGATLAPDTRAFGVGSDGAFYVSASDGGQNGGVVKIAADGASCSVISYSGTSDATIAAIGSGPTFDFMNAGVMIGDTLFGGVFDRAGLFAVDVTSGARTLPSSWSIGITVGSGDDAGTRSIAPSSAGTLWSEDSEATSHLVVKIDLATGNRTGVDVATGPLSAGAHTHAIIAGLNVYGDFQGHLVVSDAHSVYLVDPASKDSNRISR